MLKLKSQRSEITDSLPFLHQLFKFKEEIFISQGRLIILLISDGRREDLDLSSSEFQEALSSWFTNTERNEYSRKNKKHHWIYGRVLAKNSIKKLLEYSSIGNYSLNDIEILNDTPHKPKLRLLRVGMPSIFFSISHKLDKIISVSSFNEIGIDIEKIRSFSPKLLSKFVNSRDLLNSFNYFLENVSVSVSQEEILTTIWCIKEAVSKATGQGLRLSLNNIEIKMKHGRIFVRIKIQGKTERFHIRLLKDGDYIIAIAEKIKRIK